ncbi:MAG: hypothetical protein JWL77_7028, partial [Chthonomonadaceae bacterium]|nr:hypothetical protein [Chthonomonadaceae bacterium]
PNLVRVRFSVDGKADQFQGKVKWELKGKTLTVSFPNNVVAAKKEENSDHEKSLLAKVLGTHEDSKVEKINDQAVKPAKAEVANSEPREEKQETKLENRGHHLTGNGSATPNSAPNLGGAKPAPSALRSFFAMILVVGGLGLVLVYVKKKKNVVQAKKVGDSWFSNLLPNGKKQKSLIEIVGVHALGPKQSITVVRIRGQQLVLGVTEGNVQLITQLDSDDDIDVMDDPKVADSLGKIFGAKPKIEPVAQSRPAQGSARPAQNQHQDLGASFNAMLKNSTGAGAIVARNAYQAQGGNTQVPQATRSANPSTVSNTGLQSSVRDQIKQRLQGMRNG